MNDLLTHPGSAPPPAPPADDFSDDGGNDDNRDGDDRPLHWTTVATFSHPAQAHLARLRLEDEGIPVFIADENINAVAWHYAIAVGGAKLQVPLELADRARELLDRPAPGPTDVVAIDPDRIDQCPRCGSTEVRQRHWLARRSVALILLGIFTFSFPGLLVAGLVIAACFFLTTRRQTCDNCGWDWQRQPARGFEVLPSARDEASGAVKSLP